MTVFRKLIERLAFFFYANIIIDLARLIIERKVNSMEYQYASNGKANAGLATGIIGTALGVLNGGLGMIGNGYGCGYPGMYNNVEGKQLVTKDELDYVQTIGRKDAEIALLKSEQNTEVKIADVYERLITRINADQRAQADVNAAQMVYNANANSAISVLQNQVSVLNSLTKTVVPIDNICPEPMQRYNSWTAPTA